jgi:CrcB protein
MLRGENNAPRENQDIPESPHELASITPTARDDEVRTHQAEPRRRKQKGVASQNNDSDGALYDVPEVLANLNEVGAPSPDENPHEQLQYRRSFLETTWSQQKEYQRDQRHRRLSGGGAGEGGEGQESPAEEPKEAVAGHERASRAATEIYILSYLILFSILGTLARVGLDALTRYPGAPVGISVLWANFGGSLLMGYFSEDRRLFMDSDKSQNGTKPEEERCENASSPETGRGGSGGAAANEPDPEALRIAARKMHLTFKKTIPLYIGLTTGFCGSFTSFSSFIRDDFLALSNSSPTIISASGSSSVIPRNGGFSFMALLAVNILTLCVCISALKFGAHLAIALHYITPSIPVRLIRRIFDRMTVVVALGAWLGAVFMAIWPPDRPSGSAANRQTTWTQETWRGRVLFSVIFAPLGCMARFYASLKLNGLKPSFPVGTFVVNIFGTIILGMAWDLQHAPLGSLGGRIGGGLVGCQVLQGVMDGFCGCLTTVSTWVLELTSLRRRHAYTYGVASVGVALAFMTIIMGSLRWTRGFADPVCSS